MYKDLNCFKRLEELIKNSEKKDMHDAILERAIENAPKDTGKMIDSGKVDGDKIIFEQEYATLQHEDLTIKHQNGGQAKFLEKAPYEIKDKIIKILTGE